VWKNASSLVRLGRYVVDSVVDPLNQDPDPAFLDIEDNVVDPMNPDTDQAFQGNPDSDPDPGLWWLKILKNIPGAAEIV
jgi:hypothetical protein